MAQALLERPAVDVGVRVERPPADRRGLLVALLGCFAVVTALGLRGHAMWFDELQAWNIARASHSLADLYANLRYEGHPILWYLPLFALTRVTGNPHAMQALQWAVATGTASLVLFRAPFSIPLRVATLAGYFFAFEYGVISRSYGLTALLFLGALALLGRERPQWVGVTVLLVLLAWSSLPGAVLALALVLAVAWVLRGHYVSVGIVVFAALGAAATCVPPRDFASFAPGLAGDASKFGSGAGVHIASAVAGTWRGLVPLPATVGEWNSNVLDAFTNGVWIEAVLGIGLFVLVWRALRSATFARVLWSLGVPGLVVFFAIVMLPEQARYAGFFLLLFLGCAWLAAAPPGEVAVELRVGAGSRAPIAVSLACVLAAQLLATLAVYPTATVEAFSRDEDVARIIHRVKLDDAIISGQDWDGIAVAGYLDRPVYSVVRGEWIRFFVHDAREARRFDRLTDTDVLCAAAGLAERRGAVALVLDRALPAAVPIGVSGDARVYRLTDRVLTALRPEEGC